MAQGYATFGDFLLLKKRSEDALGSLWRAGQMEATGFKRIVWLRRFDQSGFDRQALIGEFPLAEHVAKTLKASSVVAGATVGKNENVPYLAWDYFPGQPLNELLARVRQEQFPMAIDNCLLIVEKLAAALAAGLALEHQGEPLIHGFLVPHMVLVSSDGEARVSGFGLAKGFLANLDRVGMQELASPYLAPEVIATGLPSRRGDVYSLGAILYELLAGQPLPVDKDARSQAIAQPQLALDEGPVPEDVAAILRKALSLRPEDRYSSAVDLKRDLEKLLYGGSYSPTTFNLALFMDRLYRQEIEEEDRELRQEKGLDVRPYYKPPKAATQAASQAVAPPPSRLGLYLAMAAVLVLAGAVVFLVSRPKGPTEEETRATMQAMLAEELAKREQSLRDELERSRQETEALRKQLEDIQKKAATSPQRLTAEEQKRVEEAQRLLAQREEETRRKEEELARLRKQKERAAGLGGPGAPAVLPTPIPPTATPESQPEVLPTLAAQPTAVPTPPPVATTPAVAPPTVTPKPEIAAVTVKEDQYWEPSELDRLPQLLVYEKPEIPASVFKSRVNQKGTVILQAVVNARGLVEDAKILRPFPVSGLGIEEACIAAAKKTRFRPGMKQGVKVKTMATLTYVVDLTQGR